MTQRLPNSFFLKLGVGCFVLGGCMELFMIKTGFYDIVTRKEAESWEDSKQEQVELRARVAQALAAQGRPVPAELQPYLSQQQSAPSAQQ